MNDRRREGGRGRETEGLVVLIVYGWHFRGDLTSTYLLRSQTCPRLTQEIWGSFLGIGTLRRGVRSVVLPSESTYNRPPDGDFPPPQYYDIEPCPLPRYNSSGQNSESPLESEINLLLPKGQDGVEWSFRSSGYLIQSPSSTLESPLLSDYFQYTREDVLFPDRNRPDQVRNRSPKDRTKKNIQEPESRALNYGERKSRKDGFDTPSHSTPKYQSVGSKETVGTMTHRHTGTQTVTSRNRRCRQFTRIRMILKLRLLSVYITHHTPE